MTHTHERTEDMDEATAYRKGWEASKRTKTFDMERGEDRFRGKYGQRFAAYWSAGWIDYSSDLEYGDALKTDDERENETPTFTLVVHHVGIAIDGAPTYVVDIPSTQGREAAERRAVFVIASQHPMMDMERITVCEAE